MTVGNALREIRAFYVEIFIFNSFFKIQVSKEAVIRELSNHGLVKYKKMSTGRMRNRKEAMVELVEHYKKFHSNGILYTI